MGMSAEQLVIEYARQTAIMAHNQHEYKALVVDYEGLPCDSPHRESESSGEQTCIRRYLDCGGERNTTNGTADFCEMCAAVWPYVNGRYKAKQERAKIKQKINALGNRLIKKGIHADSAD